LHEVTKRNYAKWGSFRASPNSYQWSPVIVKAMEKDEEFKEEIKEIIDGVLELLGKEVE
jgi:hypothetical protein